MVFQFRILVILNGIISGYTKEERSVEHNENFIMHNKKLLQSTG